MKRFKNILYFADGAMETCTALERAVTLARSNDARLTVVDVLENAPALLEAALELPVERESRRLLEERRVDLAQPLDRHARLDTGRDSGDDRLGHGRRIVVLGLQTCEAISFQTARDDGIEQRRRQRLPR